VSAATRVAGVIGDPVRHSLSPAIHQAAFAAAGLDWVFVAFEVPAGRGAAAIEAMRVLGIDGLSVTMPHKEDVIAALDELTPSAEALGAVNCVVARDGRLIGDNTDGEGLVVGLAESAGLDLAGRSVLVLGAGGAARSVVRASSMAGAAEVVVVGRTPTRVDAAVAVGEGVARAGFASEVAGAEVVINATPVGMGDDASLPLDPNLLRSGQVVVDLVYHPLRTPLLRAAAAAGARTVDGLAMLVGQAALSFRQWTGKDAPVDAMRAGAMAGLAARDDH
jgi:shikimate dehydrogenase